MDYSKYLRENVAKFVEDIPEDLKCILCREILLDPHLVPCGHNYCGACLANHLNSDTNKLCIGPESICKEEKLKWNENIVKNVAIVTKIKKLNVECCLEGCGAIVKVIDMEKHVESCNFKYTTCPFIVFGCAIENMSKESMKRHFELNDVEHSVMLVDMNRELRNKINELTQEIGALKLNEEQHQTQSPQNTCNNLEHNQLEQEFQGQINLLKQSFQGQIHQLKQNFQGQIVQLKQDFQGQIVQLTNENESQKSKLKVVETEVVKANSHLKRLEEENSRLRNENESEKSKIKVVETQVVKANSHLKRLEEENSRLTKHLQCLFDERNNNEDLQHMLKLDNKLILNELTNQNDFSEELGNKSYYWIVENYSNKYKEAKQNNDVYFESPQFFLKGYCLVLMFYPCITWRLLGDFSCVKFKILKSHTDKLVEWPCQLQFKFSIIRRNDNSDFTASRGYKHVATNKGEDVWKYPGYVSSVSPLYCLFYCGATNVTRHNLIKDDSILIRSSVV